jgi:NAD(P)H-hydrate epimerase
MERAGRAVARAAIDLLGGTYGRRAVVVCGKGNNGGDGFVAARHLARAGVRTAVVAVERLDDLREPAATNAARLDEVPVRVLPFSGATLERELARADVAVDAIFGTGFRGIPEDEWAEAIMALNGSRSPVVAWTSLRGERLDRRGPGEAVWRTSTVTFGLPR